MQVSLEVTFISARRVTVLPLGRHLYAPSSGEGISYDKRGKLLAT